MMITKYSDKEITEIQGEDNKVKEWQNTELAVNSARVNLKKIPEEIGEQINEILSQHPIDLKVWKEMEKLFDHDLAAFIAERQRLLPPELKGFLHDEGMTSYDTEEPAFAQILKESIAVIEKLCFGICETLTAMAPKYRYTIMNGRTHGQEAELQTFGKRCLTWFQVLRFDIGNLKRAQEGLRHSKISGAIGNYGSLDPEIEREALEILGFKPFYGATQIMPREVYAPIGQALCQIVLTLDKIALDIRLGARSGRPIFQEPFGKKQKGSSAMPHKKNTIKCERIAGMARLAKGYLDMIMDNIETWEERAIEQSSVERIAWPDLFHVTAYSLKIMEEVLAGLMIFPDNMLLEVVDSRGCYASSEAKEFLKKLGFDFGITTEDAYRIVQLAAFNAFEPGKSRKELRDIIPTSLSEGDNLLVKAGNIADLGPISIKEIIAEGRLKFSDQLDISEEKVGEWNAILGKMFEDEQRRKKWSQIFLPSYLLRNEAVLYQKILNI